MHDCQKFREEWIAGSLRDQPTCEECRVFCEDAHAVLAALRPSPDFIPEASHPCWTGFDNRLRHRLLEDISAERQRVVRHQWTAGLATAASVALLIAWGSLQLPNPGVKEAVVFPERIEFDRIHIADLDPGVVAFLEQSEAFVRDFTKIDASLEEDIDDARERAGRRLAEIAAKKQAAGDFAPVRIALDEYESVLREIKNLNSPGDVADIQTRIRRNGLIASLKAYQPRVIRVSQR